MLLMYVLMTCLCAGASAGPDPNQTPQRPDVTAVPQAAPSADANGALQRPKSTTTDDGPDKGGFDWTKTVACAVAAVALLLNIYQYRRRKADAALKKKVELKVEEDVHQARRDEASQTAEDQYRALLTQELGTVQVLGTHEIAKIPVDLLETFVSLDISPPSEGGCARDSTRPVLSEENRRGLMPEAVMKLAFKDHRMLLILGEAGSGKTTLVKYYATLCLKAGRHQELGFREPLLPIYFPLRDIEFQGDTPCLLHEGLAKWSKQHYKEVSAQVFLDWLNHRRTLVLLDGLDEISDLEKRRRVCEWIDATAASLHRACVVVTSRWTGYRKLDQIQFECDHVVADIKEFSAPQQAQFLRKWFVAAYRKEMKGEPPESIQQRGLDRAQAIVDFLALDQNKGVRELVAVPMLLQIVAIIWKEHENLPQSRAELYATALNYLTYYRERHRHLTPPLELKQGLRVLRQIALWMQEDLASDDVRRDTLHERMQPLLQPMNANLSAGGYCEYLRDRAALLADSGADGYVFRHKSFREYLAGVALVERCKDAKRLKQVVEHLGDDWWEEPLRFFMGEADAALFDGFMKALFRSDVSRDLDQKTYDLLLTLVREVPEKPIKSLARSLNDQRLHDNKKRYIVDCLKTIGTPEALEAVEQFAARVQAGAAAAAARDITAQHRAVAQPAEPVPKIGDVFAERRPSFRHRYELNAEYIRIPGGSFAYEVTKKTETVRDLYFAKYPVTNQRYRLFLSYLAGREPRLGEVVPPASFSKAALALAVEEEGFKGYLGDDPGQWAVRLKSRHDEEKRFKGDDQPVVGVSWFDASMYCLWISMLEAVAQGATIEKLGREYRLPTEMEWVWAAFGREPGGGLREYPWPAEKDGPSDKLANYAGNVGATTPMGRYPDGATPEGLMDMAGNVWEWMENLYGHEEYREARSLRGGSWDYGEFNLGRSGRNYNYPDSRSNDVGFRVVCSQS